MSLLLGSVSASAIIAGGGGGYPTTATVSLIYDADSGANVFFPVDHAVTVDGLGGSYLVAFYGGWGGSQDTDGAEATPSCAEATSITKFHTSEDNYDVIIWSVINMPAGPTTMNISHSGVSGTVFRSAILVYKLVSVNPDPIQFQTFTANNQSSNSITFTPPSANGMIIGVAHTEGTLAHTWSGSPILDYNENMALENFWWSAARYENVSDAEQTITVTEPAAISRELLSLIWMPYQTELQDQSVNIDGSALHLIGGSSRNLAVRNAPTYVLANNAGPDRLHINNATTYLVAVP